MNRKTPQYATPQILHDAPLRDTDQADFHFDEFAVTLARLIAAQKTRCHGYFAGPWV
jgi:hypothetical protein